jgi:hypothetical protein
MPAFKHLTSFAAVFLVLYGVFPVMVSAAYGGNPPPHIARLLDKQMEVFATIAPIVFTPFKVFASFEKQPDKKQPSKVILIGYADPALKLREVLRPPSR